jgi:hypothetical protein
LVTVSVPDDMRRSGAASKIVQTCYARALAENLCLAVGPVLNDYMATLLGKLPGPKFQRCMPGMFVRAKTCRAEILK